jgi:hypothetical protein
VARGPPFGPCSVPDLGGPIRGTVAIFIFYVKNYLKID